MVARKNKSFDSQLIIPIDNKIKEALAVVAKHEQRSMTAQARYLIHQGLFMIAEDDRLNEIEANSI